MSSRPSASSGFPASIRPWSARSPISGASRSRTAPWFGRWGVNYIYGIGAVLPALAAIGEDMSQPYIGRACDWLVAHQQENGGWGESCASYMEAECAGRGDRHRLADRLGADGAAGRQPRAGRARPSSAAASF